MWRQDTSVVYRRCTVIRSARGTNPYGRELSAPVGLSAVSAFFNAHYAHICTAVLHTVVENWHILF